MRLIPVPFINFSDYICMHLKFYRKHLNSGAGPLCKIELLRDEMLSIILIKIKNSRIFVVLDDF